MIPNDQLVVPDISIAADGTTVFNSSVREVMINQLQGINLNDMPLLGQTFLSQVYMNVNYDLGIFSLWSARATREEDPVGIGPGGSLGCGKGSPTRPGNGTIPPVDPSGSNLSDGHKAPSSMSSGTKGGIAVGAIGGVALLSAIFLATRYYRRRHSLRRNFKPEKSSSALSSNAGAKSPAAMPTQELSKHSFTKAELPAETNIESRPTSWPSSAVGSSSKAGWQQSTTEPNSSTHATPISLEMRDLPPVSSPLSELGG